MSDLGLLADGIEIASKKAPNITAVLGRYWWLTVPVIYLTIKRWGHNRKNEDFEEALTKTILEITPVISAAIAVGFLIHYTKSQQTAPQQSTDRIIDVKPVHVQQTTGKA
ncbi:MAG: hypothetical protein RMK43_12870 [Cyclobacteriaceae bacterium]|nr:hypothetical protein [Cyclobacteriaceae bacterium]